MQFTREWWGWVLIMALAVAIVVILIIEDAGPTEQECRTVLVQPVVDGVAGEGKEFVICEDQQALY